MEDPNSFQTFSPQPGLLVTIRFSASIPDILLEVPHPSTATAAGLKQLIRKKLPDELVKRRLRLIYAGRALEDGVGLGVSLRLELEPGDAKGKRPIRGDAAAQDSEEKRIYIHCSIGDIVLSDEELATEVHEAQLLANQQHHEADEARIATPSPNQDQDHGQTTTSTSTASTSTPTAATTSTTPAPRGFDRLLSAGFTVAEVSALRSQFLALQSLTHTPDTMPSGEDLRRLEDRWMDEGSNDTLPGGGSGSDGAGGNAFGNVSSDASGVLDDMLWGSVMGFFWPIGCGLWLLREEGVWSWRKGLAVFVGVLVNFGFGAVRWLN